MPAREASRSAAIVLSFIRSGAWALPGSSSATPAASVALGSVRLRAMALSFRSSVRGARLRAGRAPRRARSPGPAVASGRQAGGPGVAPPPACRRSSRSRRRLRVVVGAAAVLLRLVEQLDLPLQQLVLEVFALQVELDLAREPRLACVALVEAALDDDPRRREGDLAFPAEA